MKVSRMYLATIEILKQQPSTKTVIIEGETVSVKELVSALSKMMGWLYKELTTDDLEKVTRCCECRYYKKYKKKGAMKGTAFYACSQDMNKRRPDFFCKDGEPPYESQRPKKTGA